MPTREGTAHWQGSLKDGRGVVRTESGTVPEIADAEFQRLAAAAKDGCPVSRALAAVDIDLRAELAG